MFYIYHHKTFISLSDQSVISIFCLFFSLSFWSHFDSRSFFSFFFFSENWKKLIKLNLKEKKKPDCFPLRDSVKLHFTDSVKFRFCLCFVFRPPLFSMSGSGAGAVSPGSFSGSVSVLLGALLSTENETRQQAEVKKPTHWPQRSWQGHLMGHC